VAALAVVRAAPVNAARRGFRQGDAALTADIAVNAVPRLLARARAALTRRDEIASRRRSLAVSRRGPG